MPPGVPADTVAVQIQSNDALSARDCYPRPRDVVAPDAIGRWSAVKIAGKNEILFRVVRRGYEPGTWNLSMLQQPQHEEINISLDWAVPILWVKT